jgi:hypothetical protein
MSTAAKDLMCRMSASLTNDFHVVVLNQNMTYTILQCKTYEDQQDFQNINENLNMKLIMT